MIILSISFKTYFFKKNPILNSYMKPLNKKTGLFINDLAQLFTDDTVLSVSNKLEEYFLIKVEKSWVDS